MQDYQLRTIMRSGSTCKWHQLGNQGGSALHQAKSESVQESQQRKSTIPFFSGTTYRLKYEEL